MSQFLRDAAVDPEGSKPLYLQVEEAVEASIRDNGLKPGDQIPSPTALAKTLPVSELTVRRASSPDPTPFSESIAGDSSRISCRSDNCQRGGWVMRFHERQDDAALLVDGQPAALESGRGDRDLFAPRHCWTATILIDS